MTPSVNRDSILRFGLDWDRMGANERGIANGWAGKPEAEGSFLTEPDAGEFGTPKSRRSTRSVPLADIVAGELDRLHQASRARADDDLVFADPRVGGPLDKAAVLRRYRRALEAAQLEPTHRFHNLRHTFGTRMAAAGVPMRTLQEWMGHRDIETTQTVRRRRTERPRVSVRGQGVRARVVRRCSERAGP